MKNLNHLLLTATIMLLALLSAEAQTTLGIKNGIAASTFSDKGNLYNDNNVTLSYTAGFFANIQLNKSLALQPEINYVRKGRSNETFELNSDQKIDFLLHYLHIPVLFQYKNDQLLNKSGSVFYLNAGPYAAFVLNTQTRLSYSENNSSFVLTNKSQNTDWGAVLGIGFQTPIRKKDIRFDLRYDLGLSEIEGQPEEYRTKALSLTIGMLL